MRFAFNLSHGHASASYVFCLRFQETYPSNIEAATENALGCRGTRGWYREPLFAVIVWLVGLRGFSNGF